MPTELRPGLWMVDPRLHGAPENLSTYVVAEPVPTVIEPGPASCREGLLAGLAALGVDDVAQIVVTHVHLDHSGGAGVLLTDFPRARVFVHERGARHLADPARLVASATRVYGEDAMAAMWGEVRPVPTESLRTVGDGDRIDLGAGRHLEVLYTPGHAQHHVTLVDSGTGTAFVGDSVGITFPEMAIVHPTVPPPDVDVELMIDQYDRYRERSVPALAFAHFGLRPDVDALLEEAEHRLRLWTATVAAHPAAAGDDLGALLAAANLADLRAQGRPERHIARIHERTVYATEAAGLRRYGEQGAAAQRPG